MELRLWFLVPRREYGLFFMLRVTVLSNED